MKRGSGKRPGASGAPKQEAQSRTGLEVNGWRIYSHPLFDAQLRALKEQVGRDREHYPETYLTKAAAKRLAAIDKILRQVIPSDPDNSSFRLGNTLGAAGRQWRRVKFFQQYRLFFRFSKAQRVVVVVWVNDERTLRAYESDRDAYRVFRGMLADGHPPADWNALCRQAGPVPAEETLITRD